MNRARTVQSPMHCPTHFADEKPCVVMNGMAVHTVTLAEGSFAMLVIDRDDTKNGAALVLDRDDVAALRVLLDHAIEDAERIDRGEAPRNAPPTSTKQ